MEPYSITFKPQSPKGRRKNNQSCTNLRVTSSCQDLQQRIERPSLRNYNAPIVCPIRDKDGDLGCIGKPLKCHIWARGCKYLEYITRTQMGLLVQRPYPESCTIYITPRWIHFPLWPFERNTWSLFGRARCSKILMRPQPRQNTLWRPKFSNVLMKSTLTYY